MNKRTFRPHRAPVDIKRLPSCFYHLILIFFLCVTLLSGCATTGKKDDVFALVDGDPITIEDLRYALEIAHRRQDLSGARHLNMSEYIQQLVDDRLVMHEARRAGLDRDPAIEEKVTSYALRESVARLYDEEVIQKVSVTKQDIRTAYQRDYEEFRIALIEVASEDDAQRLYGLLNEGADFAELARKYSIHASAQDGGAMSILRRSMVPPVEKALAGLQPGERSDITQMGSKFEIFLLIDRQAPPDDGLEPAKEGLEKKIRTQRVKERSDQYLAELHDRAQPELDEELLEAIQFSGEGKSRNDWLRDERLLVRVDGSQLTAGAFAALLPDDRRESKDRILKAWLDRTLVDVEAMSRGYEKDAEFQEGLNRYENQILKRAFIQKMVIPEIEITDEEQREYYDTHREQFQEEGRYRIQQITVESETEAEEILKSIQKGADFSWLAKNRSMDYAASRGGELGWMTRSQLSETALEALDGLEPGQVTPILRSRTQFQIVRLQEKSEGAVMEFDKVKSLVFRKVLQDKHDRLYGEYVEKLREDADIVMYDDVVESFRQGFQK